MKQQHFDLYSYAAPPEVDVEAIRQQWLALQPPNQITARHLPVPIWARRPFSENGEQAWRMLWRDVSDMDLARAFCIYIHVPFCADRCHFRGRDTNLYFTFPVRGEDCFALSTVAEGCFEDYHYRHSDYTIYTQNIGDGFPGLQRGLRRNQLENRLQPLTIALLAGGIPRYATGGSFTPPAMTDFAPVIPFLASQFASSSALR